MTKLLMIGGPLDGIIQEFDDTFDPKASLNVVAHLPDKTEFSYNVVFFKGEKMQFPVCIDPKLTADDVFFALLNWYSVKPRVRPSEDGKTNPPEPVILDAKSEEVVDPALDNVETHCGPDIALSE